MFSQFLFNFVVIVVEVMLNRSFSYLTDEISKTATLPSLGAVSGCHRYNFPNGI